MKTELEAVEAAVAAIEENAAIAKGRLAELHPVASNQLLASDRNAWQASVGALLTLIESHGDEALTAAAVRIVNTNPYTGSHTGEPRADIATTNMNAAIDRAVAAGLVVRRPVIDDLGDLPTAIRTLEADIGNDPDTSELEADAMRIVVSYAQLADKMLKSP
jgi:hypothetical protein